MSLALPGPVLASLAFWVLAFGVCGASLGVLFSRNPVHSVFFLILAFFNAAGLFLLLGAEFLAMLLVIVYVGAVAVLFLFVVMMLDMEVVALREGFLRYLPLGALLALALFAELAIVLAGWRAGGAAPLVSEAHGVRAEVPNTVALGRLLYDDYVLLFQGAGLILLVAMIGAIVLTHRHRPGVLRQSISEQTHRTASRQLVLHDPAVGEGVHWND